MAKEYPIQSPSQPWGQSGIWLAGLAVHGDDVGRGLADGAAADVGLDLAFLDGHHGNGFCGGEPVALVVAAGVVADVVEVAEEEGHGGEASEAGAGHAQVLVVALLVSLHVEKTVAVPHLAHSRRAGRDLRRLAVLDE